MTLKYAVAAAVVLGFAGAAYADDTSQFVIIKDANKHCRVVEKSLVSEDELGMQIEHGRGQYRPQGRLRQLVVGHNVS